MKRLEDKRGVAAAKEIEPMRWHFAGDTVSPQDEPEQKEKRKLRIALEPKQAPKRITLTQLTGLEDEIGDKLEGIYEFKGDALRICIAGEPGKARPTEFKAEKGGDTGLIELERVPKPAEKEPPEAAELKKLQGVWRVTKIENNRGVAPAEVIEPMRWEIVGSTVIAIDGPDEKQRHKSRIALDATTSPKRITQTELTDAEDKPGRKIECIYELKGDTLRICMGDTRPTEFKVEKGVDGGLIELERMPDAVSELKKLQGKWRVTKLVGDAGVATAKEIESMRWEFAGDAISCQDGPGKEVKMKFAFDATKSPKQITMTAQAVPEAKVGTKLEGIYELKDDTLRICFGKVRPTEFKVAKEGNDGLVELERIPKPEAKAPEKKVLTPDQIVQGKIEGAVRVEFTVESLYWETGTSAEKMIPMNFKLRGEKTDGDLFQVRVAGRVFTRLSELGIENTPKENSTEGTPAVYRHFEGKTVRVNGVVKRLPLAQRDGFLYWLRIDNLDQIESVSKK